MPGKTTSERFFFWTAVFIIVMGMALRVLMFTQNRSLFIDEASLSSQLIERPYSDLFKNLKYQYAPPFFVVAVKFMTAIFGANEYALRLIPLLASLIGLVFFYRLCRQYLEDIYCLFPLFLFSFGMPVLRYATEVKQYSTDVLITISLLLLCAKWKPGDLDIKTGIFWVMIGGFVVWFSMPGVFLLFGIGVYYLFEIYKNKSWTKAVYIIGPILFWLLNFGIYYYAIIRKDIGLENLEDYHGRFFLPLLPGSLAEVHQFKNILLSFYQTAIGATTVAAGFGILTSIWALVYLYKNDRSRMLLFVLPILAAMLASGLKLYSLIPRLTLFFIPILILLIGIGKAELFKRSPKVLRYLLFVPVFIILINQKGYPYFYKRFQIEELRPVLYYIHKNWARGDGAFLHHEAEHAYVFYSQFHEKSNAFNVADIYIGGWSEPVEDIVIPKRNRIWLIFSHVGVDEIEQYVSHFKNGYTVIEEYKVVGASVVLVEIED